MDELSHVDESSGDVQMVDVGHKPPVAAQGGRARRRADGAGDLDAPARPAEGRRAHDREARGDHGREETSNLIPLCHPLPLDHVDVELEVGEGRVDIIASAEMTAQTGVEMEALTAVAVAALTVYDMAKAIDKNMTITEITLVSKEKETG